MEKSAVNLKTNFTKPDHQIREVAQKLEATFLAEMLKAARLGETENSFSKNDGEVQFASFLRTAQAEKIAEAGGIGLKEVLYRQIMETRDD